MTRPVGSISPLSDPPAEDKDREFFTQALNDKEGFLTRWFFAFLDRVCGFTFEGSGRRLTRVTEQFFKTIKTQPHPSTKSNEAWDLLRTTFSTRANKLKVKEDVDALFKKFVLAQSESERWRISQDLINPFFNTSNPLPQTPDPRSGGPSSVETQNSNEPAIPEINLPRDPPGPAAQDDPRKKLLVKEALQQIIFEDNLKIVDFFEGEKPLSECLPSHSGINRDSKAEAS